MDLFQSKPKSILQKLEGDKVFTFIYFHWTK